MTARLATHPDVSAQADAVLGRLTDAGVDVEYVGGLDTAEPFTGLREHHIDLALVGIGALRGSVAEDFTTVAVLPRLETRDVLVSLSGRAAPLAELDPGATVGLVGARRAAFLAAHRPDVRVKSFEAGDLHAIARAAGRGGPPSGADGAALDGLIMSALDARAAGLLDAAVEALEPKAWLPEPGQGALALLARHPIAEATALDHLPTRTALRTELSLLDAIGAGDDTTLGCLAQPSGRWIRLWAAAASPAGDRLVRSDRTGPLDEAEALGRTVADELLARGYRLVAAPLP